MVATGTLAVSNDTIYVHSSTQTFILAMMTEYSVFNVTIVCKHPHTYGPTICNIVCNETNSNQFVIIDDTCSNCSIYRCNLIDSIDDVENTTRDKINKINSLMNEFDQLYDNECNGNDSMLFDIGYPMYGESFIVSYDYRSGVCCRGSESCAHSKTIFSNLGNIFCTGEFSCGESESIWTGDYLEIFGETPEVSIFCMAYAACFGSHLESADRIVCGVYAACENTHIEGALRLYCVYNSCSRTIIKQVQVAHIFDLQTEITVFSGNVGTMTVYFIGKNSGTDVDFTCGEGDKCYIHCDKNSCSSETTILTCYGKCFVSCDGNEDDKDCVNIEYSESPTTSPSAAPSNAPTISPTAAPSSPPTSMPTIGDALTHRDINTWFNFVLWSVLGVIVFVVILGCIDARKFRINELFVWNSILSFGFYSIDFFSDLFFSMKLYLFMIDDSHDINEYQMIYTILFSFSIAFIFIPLIFNLFQLHQELSKWLNDPILSRTEAPVWILSFMRMLYFVSIISGSSFSAVALLNSNLFQLRIFGMGLSRYHQKMFANKRFSSVVLLEVCMHACCIDCVLHVGSLWTMYYIVHCTI